MWPQRLIGLWSRYSARRMKISSGRETNRPELSAPIWIASGVIEGKAALGRVLAESLLMRYVQRSKVCSDRKIRQPAQLRQKAGVSNTNSVKISSRPRSMVIVSIHFACGSRPA